MKRLLGVLIVLNLFLPNAHSAQWDVDTPVDGALIPDAPGIIRDNNDALDRLLADYQGMYIQYSSATTIVVSAGTVTVSNSGGTERLFLRNTSSTNVTFSDLDTGAEASSTTYFLYAIASTAASETATFKVSTSSSAPTGVTYYKKLGSFYNNSSSDISNYKVYSNAYNPSPTDSSGIPKVTAIYDYSTSTSSYTLRQSDLKVAYGTASVGGASTASISNLPFSSTSTYSVTCSFDDTSSVSEDVGCAKSSGSGLTIKNNQASARNINWVAVGY